MELARVLGDLRRGRQTFRYYEHYLASQLRLDSPGEIEFVLKDGHRSRVSRTYRAQLEKRLGQSL